LLTEGQRTIRADEMYYDFEQKKAIAVNAVMKTFDITRGIPIYVRAAKLRQVAENQFGAKDIVLTSSEFHRPQIMLTASDVLITDTTVVDAQAGKVSNSSYDAQLRNVKMKVEDKTVFYWPYMRCNLQDPDVPIKSMRAGYSNTWGTSFESEWYLARLLGLHEPKGTDSTLSLDYYSKRGFGTGAEVRYERENYYGKVVGYFIDDTGKDKLGRISSRQNLTPDTELRGRFSFMHRQFLPYNWQFTTGINYISDENFLESYYRKEFNSGLEPETYAHMKRAEDNWALSILVKGRINDFADEVEELPSVEYHRTGQSLFDDTFTLYSDTEISRLRQMIGDNHSMAISDESFTFMSHRTELDMPISAGNFKFVPFVAADVGYDDRSGFTRGLVDGSNTGSFGEEEVWLGEGGVRVSSEYWKVYPDVKSRLWDLNQLRHIIKPEITAVTYAASDSVVEQRDTFNIGVSQRLQTKRGPADKQQLVDWMRLDVDFTAVEDPAPASESGPDRFIWNRSIVPLRVLSAPDIFNGDLGGSLRRVENYGPRRDYFGGDYVWRVSDTLAILGDLNYDTQSAVVQQGDIGFTRLCWPNLSYYIGTRYLRNINVLEEKNSNMFTFAITYVLDPRYTIVFSQQYDFAYKANVRTDLMLIRRYHRICYGLTYSVDESLDTQSIVFSIWPQGVPEFTLGQRNYAGLDRSAGY
jgi:lipopolysaccharide assembly outer membrane protein LptD (OstA)